LYNHLEFEILYHQSPVGGIEIISAEVLPRSFAQSSDIGDATRRDYQQPLVLRDDLEVVRFSWSVTWKVTDFRNITNGFQESLITFDHRWDIWRSFNDSEIQWLSLIISLIVFAAAWSVATFLRRKILKTNIYIRLDSLDSLVHQWNQLY
jgi:hypothetical protein